MSAKSSPPGSTILYQKRKPPARGRAAPVHHVLKTSSRESRVILGAMKITALILVAAAAAFGQAVAQQFRLVRSQSGPSGKVVGTRMLLDQVRTGSFFRRTNP